MAKRFDRMLEKATAPTLLEPDWEGILNCVDFIRAGDVPVKAAVTSMRKRIHNDNPHVAHHALLVFEAAMKNCGEKFHKEIAIKDFMEELKHLAHESDRIVKDKVLEMIQCWSHAFRDHQEYKIICDTHNLMKLEGFEFPAMRESDIMFTAESAPDWVDSDKCYRCREKFGLLTRKHHCRACGQIFCDKCSNRYMILPHIGIEKEVRVCEDCNDKLNKKSKDESKEAKKEAKKERRKRGESSSGATSGAGDVDPKVKEQAIKEREEEELQLAIAISQSEAEEKERQRQNQLMSLYNGADNDHSSKNGFSNGAGGLGGYKGVAHENTPPTQRSVFADIPAPDAAPNNFGISQAATEEVDPELARYLNRAHWEQRRVDQKSVVQNRSNPISTRKSPEPSAPPPSDTGSEVSSLVSNSNNLVPRRDMDTLQNGGTNNDDTEQFTRQLKSQVEVLVNRIRSNQARGRSIVNDSSINTLFLNLTGHHADVLNRMQALDDKKNYYEMLQDRLAHIQEARQAVDALRDEHERKRQEELLEAQRRRQVQMQAKLEIMRQKKHEMLEHQRQMALQRMQQQQQEIQMRRQMAAMGINQPQQVVMVPGPNGQLMPVMMPQPGMQPGQMMIDPNTGMMVQQPVTGQIPVGPPAYTPQQIPGGQQAGVGYTPQQMDQANQQIPTTQQPGVGYAPQQQIDQTNQQTPQYQIPPQQYQQPVYQQPSTGGEAPAPQPNPATYAPQPQQQVPVGYPSAQPTWSHQAAIPQHQPQQTQPQQQPQYAGPQYQPAPNQPIQNISTQAPGAMAPQHQQQGIPQHTQQTQYAPEPVPQQPYYPTQQPTGQLPYNHQQHHVPQPVAQAAGGEPPVDNLINFD